jgi:hypothetical protein
MSASARLQTFAAPKGKSALPQKPNIRVTRGACEQRRWPFQISRFRLDLGGIQYHRHVADERQFMDLETDFRVCMQGDKWEGSNAMLKAILGATSAVALASPALAADLPVPAPYSEGPGYEAPYEYGMAPPVVVEEPPPAVFVRPPVIVAPPPPVVVHEYPFYTAPRVYAYGGPGWHGGWGWGHRHHGGW